METVDCMVITKVLGKRLIVVAFAVLGMSLVAVGQRLGGYLLNSKVQTFAFHHIDTKGYAVRVMYRDVNGIVWLGTTSGLLNLPQLLSRNPSGYYRNLDGVMSIKRISGDSQGRLWIKTIYNDTYLYNPKQGHFVAETPTVLSRNVIDDVRDITVQPDEEDCIWIWKDNRIYWLKKDDDRAKMMLISSDDQLKNIIPEGKQLTALSQKALYKISPAKKQIVQMTPLPGGYNMRDHLFITSDHTPWIWASGNVWKNDGDQWALAFQAGSDITGVAEDDERRLWIGTQSEGIYVCDSQGTVLTHLQFTPGDNYGLLSNQVEMVSFEPVSHSMWIAYTKGGLSVYSKIDEDLMLHDIKVSTDKVVSTDVLTFAPARTKHGVWIGLEKRGVWLHDSYGDTNVISSGSVVSLYADHDDNLWAGFYRHGLVYRSVDGREKLYLEGTSPYALADDGEGHLFVALLGKGVWQLNPESEEVTDTHLEPKFVFDLEYHQGKLYAASTEGLYVMNKNRQWELITEGHFHYLNIDHQGYFWLIGNEGDEGLTLLDPIGRPIDLPAHLKKARLRSIAIDKEGHVWTATSSELLMLEYDPKAKEPLTYNTFRIISQGHQVFYNYHTAIVDDNGVLWLGATTGYQAIDTRRLLAHNKEKSAARPLVMGAVTINDNILSPGLDFNGRVLLHKDIAFVNSLDLRYNENNLVIECSQPCDPDYTTDTYYYQLKGFSSVWHPMEDGTIILSNLPPGNYQLLTRTQSSEPHLLLSIHIAPPFWLSWWAFCIYAMFVAGVIYGLLRYFRNRHAYQLQLRELQLQQEQQAQMNELKLRFFTNISHDLRTPLTLIIGPVEELRNSNIEKLDSLTSIRSFNTTVLQPSLEMIHRNALHLLSLVNQILDFRRLEFGKEKPLLSYGNMVSLLNDICNSFRLKAEKENIRLTYAPSMGRLETMLDSDKITKIMMNLLSNAFKFTSAGGSITVTLDVSGGQIIISVTDTGIGISDSDKEHLFERFYQVQELPESTTDAHTHGLSEFRNRTPMGSGIGLHIVREYVHLLGGAITVSDNTEAGHGSTFRFTLPLKKNDGQTTKREDNPGSSLPTLLLVDDNTDMLNYMSQSMGSNFEILTAANGIEAIRLLEEKDVDMIISDIMMPEMDGLEFCQHIKTDFKTSHIPVVLLSAKSMTNDELKGLEAGADDYITKPFSMDILRQRVHNLMERSRQQHERFAKELDIEPSEITVTSLDEQFIAKAISIVESHIAEPDFSVEQLSEEIGIHRAQLYKKLLHLTGKSPQQFVRLLRLKRGKQLLEQSGLYVSEVAYKVGFNSPRIFSKYFKEEFGITPKDFSKQE